MNGKQLLFRSVAAFLFVWCLCADTAMVYADVPYPTYSYSEEREPNYMQSVYLPDKMIGQNLYIPDGNGGYAKAKGLNNPSDIYIDKDDHIFIADRDNNRIVQIDTSGNLILEIGTDGEPVEKLKNPEGVYVAETGEIYVADTGNKRIAVYDGGGTFIREFVQMDDVRLQNSMFIPVKIAMDLRGTLYVLLKGGNEGILMMSQEGAFLGYFGRNKTGLSILERIKRFVYTEEQIQTNANVVAPSVSGLAIGRDYYIYTCTQNVAKDYKNVAKGHIKKFNVNSEDLFLDKEFQIKNRYATSIALTSITVTDDGVIYAVDKANGFVYVYDNNGDLFVAFGSKLYDNDYRIGVFGEPTGIGVNSRNEVFVLDKIYNGIHIFKPTQLMSYLLTGVEQYTDGRYLEAKKNWENILQQNVFIRKANVGLGKIYHEQGDYVTAMRYMRNAYDQKLYSESRWQQRIIVVQQVFPAVVAVAASLFALWFVLVKLLRLEIFFERKDGGYPNMITRYSEQIRFAGNMIKHPVDTLYAVTYGGLGSVASAITLLALYILSAVASLGLTNFCFEKYGLKGFSLLNFLTFNVLPVFVWTLASYLVGSITKGQGKLRNIFIGTVYALIPLIVFRIPLAILSQALTLAEETIYYFFLVLIMAWMLMLQVTSVKETQGYDLGECFKNLLWMIFVSAMIVLFSFALYGVTVQAYSFVDEFIRELIGIV